MRGRTCFDRRDNFAYVSRWSFFVPPETTSFAEGETATIAPEKWAGTDDG